MASSNIFGGDGEATCELRVGDKTLKLVVTNVEISSSVKEIGSDSGMLFYAPGERRVTFSGILLETSSITEAEIETARQSLLEASRRKFRQI